MQATHTEPDWLTSAEVAQVFGVSVTTVNNWARAGRLRPIVKGPGVRGANHFRREDVEAFAARRAEQSAA